MRYRSLCSRPGNWLGFPVLTYKSPSSFDSSSTSLRLSRIKVVLLAALCLLVTAGRAAEKKAARARHALDLAERVFDAYQTRQKEDLTELLKRISRRVGEIYSALHPGEDLDAVSVEPWTAKGIELAIEFYGSRQRPPHGVHGDPIRRGARRSVGTTYR